MYDKLLHTPEGVRDVYNSECKERNKVVDQINHILKRKLRLMAMCFICVAIKFLSDFEIKDRKMSN